MLVFRLPGSSLWIIFHALPDTTGMGNLVDENLRERSLVF